MNEQICQTIIRLALSLKRADQTMTSEELTSWIKNHFPEYDYPSNLCRSLITASFKHAKTDEEKSALITVFTNVNGSPLWKES